MSREKPRKGGFQNRTRIVCGAANKLGLIADKGSMPSIYILSDQVAEAHGLVFAGDKRARFEALVDWLMDQRPSKTTVVAVRQNSRSEKDDFYRSWEWRTLRMQVLKHYGFACQCCGARGGDTNAAGDPVRICVDHIKALADHWELRLERSNLQVLCDECNQGKGAWDDTDHRPDTLLQ